MSHVPFLSFSADAQPCIIGGESQKRLQRDNLSQLAGQIGKTPPRIVPTKALRQPFQKAVDRFSDSQQPMGYNGEKYQEQLTSLR